MVLQGMDLSRVDAFSRPKSSMRESTLHVGQFLPSGKSSQPLLVGIKWVEEQVKWECYSTKYLTPSFRICRMTSRMIFEQNSSPIGRVI
jgi:hypothetical protein